MEQNFYLSSPEMITSHYGEEYERYYNAIVPPIFMNSLNVFEEIDDYYNAEVHNKHTYVYGRVQNPTVRILEDKVAALEHGVAAFAFASGMAAATTAVLSVVKTGQNIVCIRNAYGPLKKFIENYCPAHLGTTLTYVKGTEVSEFEDAITDNTSLVILESPSSVVFSLQDIEAVCKIAHAHGAKVYIDNTFCTPIFSNPLDLGVDIVMHTTSKYMGGHSDVVGGVLAVRDEELANTIVDNRELLGGIIGPMEAWLVLRGLRTLSVRVKEHEKIAMQVAEYLENHPKVDKVYYTGLKSHPQYALAQKQQRGNTGLIAFEIKGSTEDAKKVTNSLKIFKIGVSWGGFESLVMMPQLRFDEQTCEWLGGRQGLIRIHCGLEGVDALIADLEQALAKI
ncbi:MAG: aminotransferase class I/II-fold pyridoxal phosphate-dependent enzyme [Oscillospiraceae bacterium]|nr:aminotransferase class I/II-fold pyridoxal phosphate-dependent enzyme [Oscillospiraceae bacterium]